MVSEVKLNNNGYVTLTAGIQEKCIYCGNSYRVGTGYVVLAVNEYATINLVTPTDGCSSYAFSMIEKTGNELLVTLVEGGTYSDGINAPLWNINRITGDANPPFVCKTGGTIVGGLEAPPKLIPGTASGNSKPGGSSESPANIILKPGTSYTLKITAKGNVSLTAIVVLSYKL